MLLVTDCSSHSVYHNSHDASVSAGVSVPFQMHDGNYDMAIAISHFSNYGTFVLIMHLKRSTDISHYGNYDKPNRPE